MMKNGEEKSCVTACDSTGKFCLRNLNIKPYPILKIHGILLSIQRTFLYLENLYSHRGALLLYCVQSFQYTNFLKENSLAVFTKELFTYGLKPIFYKIALIVKIVKCSNNINVQLT